MLSCKGLFFSAALVCQWGLLLWITSPKFCNLKSVNESKSLLFMSPIILKYLPFCTSQLPVSLQCDKRLLAPGLNPFLLCPVSSSISARNRHHINLFFLLKSCCLHFIYFFYPSPAGSSLFRVAPLGIIRAFWPGVCDTFQYFIPEHVC